MNETYFMYWFKGVAYLFLIEAIYRPEHFAWAMMCFIMLSYIEDIVTWMNIRDLIEQSKQNKEKTE